MAFQAGSIFAEMELDSSPLVKGLKDAAKAVNDFQKQVEARIKQATTPLTPLQKRIKAVRNAFATVGLVAKKSLGVALIAAKLLLAPFRLLIGF